MLPSKQPVAIGYGKDFVSLDQEVSDLTAPKPETRFCLLELPKEPENTAYIICTESSYRWP